MPVKGYMKRLAGVLLIALFLAESCSGCARFKAPGRKLDFSEYSPPGTIAGEGQYVIGVRDELEVIVWKCPELDSVAIVRPEDGNITLPLIGDVKASGKTPSQLAEAIGTKMAAYVKEPRIAVGVKKFGAKKVFLFGEVQGPGVYGLERGDRLIDLIARAGSFTESAVPSCTYIIRGDYHEAKTIRVNMSRLIHNGDVSQNVYLEEGDIVYVPQSELENFNYALRMTFPSFYFAERMVELKRDIMTGGYDWNEVFKRGDRGF